MRKYLTACLAIAVAAPFAASAEQAFTARDVEVFAGPSSEYPPIAQLPPSTAVNVAGCLSDWSWCDVFYANDRGWVYAADLVVPFQGSRVAIIEYGPRIHLPVVSFSLATYWQQHYRSRPFFRDREQWVSRVHIEGSHGAPAPAGHERSARQSAPSPQSQQAQSRQNLGQSQQRQMQPQQAASPTASPPERNAPQGERARSAESARANAEARQPQAERREAAQPPQSTQAQSRTQAGNAQPSPRSEQPRPPRESPEAQQSQRTEQRAAQAPRSEPARGTESERQAQQPPRAESRPQANRAPESEQRENDRSKRERQPEGQQ